MSSGRLCYKQLQTFGLCYHHIKFFKLIKIALFYDVTYQIVYYHTQ
jgi:hypothetical protein